jgi:hypothetical protein
MTLRNLRVADGSQEGPRVLLPYTAASGTLPRKNFMESRPSTRYMYYKLGSVFLLLLMVQFNGALAKHLDHLRSSFVIWFRHILTRRVPNFTCVNVKLKRIERLNGDDVMPT